MKNLLEQLEQYGASDYYPLHMPGHKRQISHLEHPFGIDITEIDGFDNLFHAEGVLLEAQQRAAQLYGAEETFYLVNGSTCGILAAVSACVPRGGRILMARNCHKAAYHAVLLNGLHAEYLYPPADDVRGINGSMPVELVREAFEVDEFCDSVRRSMEKRNRISAVLITSPTYDGVVSDIRVIADVVHQHGAILIVDEAHGAHFAMNDYFPKSALACGADIVINSVHKTLPSMTQTALLHVQGPRVNRERLKKYLGIYQSSSPSYVLMAGIDSCVCKLLQEREMLYRTFTERLEKMRGELAKMQVLHLVNGKEMELQAFAFDRSKVLISTENSRINGPELARILREKYHMEPEMEAAGYVTAIMTVADTEEGFERLTRALLEIDEELEKTKAKADISGRRSEPNIDKKLLRTLRNTALLTITEADDSEQEQVLIEESVGRISAEFVYLYPPGIPILVPGEQIPEELPELLRYDSRIGLSVQGLSDFEGKYIRVVKLCNPDREA